MADRPVVLVDLDGVLADFDAETLRRLSDRFPEVVQPEVRSNFYIAQDFPEHKAIVRGIANEEGFFIALPLVAHAIQGWQRLIDLGYHPRVCSSPIAANPWSEREKRSWLAEHFAPVFGDEVVSEAIITGDKHLCEGLVLIDDRPQIRHHELATWRQVIFDRPYNQGVVGPRLFGWLDQGMPATLSAARTHSTACCPETT